MPFGKRPVTNDPIPQHDPPYSNQVPDFSDVTILTIRYRTSYASISNLIPDVLEVDEEPLVTATLLDYGVAPAGPFKELIHTVEAKYRGKTYEFCLSLILDLEAGLLAGREPTGFPKRLGRLSLNPSTTATTTGHVERPVGQTFVNFSFDAKTKQSKPAKLDKPFLNLRVIPSPVAGAEPSVKDLVPVDFELRPKEAWDGVGRLSFPENAPQTEPVNKMDVLRYEGASLAFGTAAVLHPSKEVFTL
ncbi:hypothetical protein ACET3X_004611 [Alternaria dauci]|uniref:Decarboxylase DEC1 n=1 Tax=Alternaria dauci TaxID=48095 RepID=A0ABR3UPP0_9PLEO